MVTKEESKRIEVRLQELNMKSMKIDIVGQTPLLMDKMSDEVRNQILEKQTGVAKGNKKMQRNIEKEIKDAIHKTSKGKIGIPASGIKMAMMECTSFVGDKSFSKKLVSGAVRIVNSDEGLILITYKKQDALKHYIAHTTKYSPQFHDWKATIQFMYDANTISAQDIVTLLNYSGFYIGVGAWRPKCRDGGSGEYGTYKVALGGKE